MRKNHGRLTDKYQSLPVQVKAAFWFLMCSFIQKAISVLTTPVFTRLLSTSEYGQWGVYHSWYGIAIVIVPVALSAGMHTQGLVKFSEEKEVFTSSLQGLVTLLVLCWGIIYLLFRSFWNHLLGLTTLQMVSLLTMVWTFSVVGFWGNEQRVGYKYRNLVLYTLIVAVVKPAVEIILVISCKDKVTARIVGVAAVELVSCFWMFLYHVRKGKKLFSARFWKYGLLFNLPLIVHYLCSTILNSADRIMIKNMVGYSEAGIYNLAYSVGMVMILFNGALSQTLSPWMFQKIKERKIKEIAPVAYSCFIIISAVNLLLILFAPEVVALFAPPSYRDAAAAIPPVAMSAFFMFCYSLFSHFEFYYEKTIQITAASIGAAALNILLNYIFIPIYGYIAAGYTTLACYMVYGICHYVFMNRACRQNCDGVIPFEGRKIIFICVPFMAMGFLMLLTYKLPYVRYGIGLAAVITGFAFRKRIAKACKRIISLKNAREAEG